MKRRGHKRVATDLTKPDLPITPMLDMSFQLLAFFVLTFRPAPTEVMLPLSLPAEGPAPSAPPPVSPDFVEDEELIIHIYSAPNGNISRIVAALKTGDAELGADKAKLFEFLKEQKSKSSTTPKLKLEFVGELNYQYVIALVDEARRAGFESVSPSLLEG